jgi:hypothetical protein
MCTQRAENVDTHARKHTQDNVIFCCYLRRFYGSNQTPRSIYNVATELWYKPTGSQFNLNT